MTRPTTQTPLEKAENGNKGTVEMTAVELVYETQLEILRLSFNGSEHKPLVISQDALDGFSRFLTMSNDAKPIQFQEFYKYVDNETSSLLFELKASQTVDLDTILQTLAKTLFAVLPETWWAFFMENLQLAQLTTHVPREAADLFRTVAELEACRLKRTKLMVRILGVLLSGPAQERVNELEPDRSHLCWYIADKVPQVSLGDSLCATQYEWTTFWRELFARLEATSTLDIRCAKSLVLATDRAFTAVQGGSTSQQASELDNVEPEAAEASNKDTGEDANSAEASSKSTSAATAAETRTQICFRDIAEMWSLPPNESDAEEVAAVEATQQLPPPSPRPTWSKVKFDLEVSQLRMFHWAAISEETADTLDDMVLTPVESSDGDGKSTNFCAQASLISALNQ